MTISAETMTPLHAFVPQTPNRHELSRLVIVEDPHLGRVGVRWRPPRPDAGWRYKCAACGRLELASCPHSFAAALVLATDLLGLSALAVHHTPHTPTTSTTVEIPEETPTP